MIVDGNSVEKLRNNVSVRVLENHVFDFHKMRDDKAVCVYVCVCVGVCVCVCVRAAYYCEVCSS